MREFKRIYVVGHLGAGKAVLAKALAEQLNWQFVDADFGMAVSTGQSLDNLLGAEGKQSYLQVLENILSFQQSREQIVVTTDESIVDSPACMSLLANEFTLYLDVSIDVQLERIGQSRPLMSCANYSDFVRSFRAQREPLYQQIANHQLSSDDGQVDAHVQAALNAFHKG